jgi:hypothetical protein
MPTTITSAGVTFNDTTSLTSANIGTAQLVNGSVTAAKLGTTEQKQIAKAWVNFNGTTSPGTIRSSFNVSSVSKIGAGRYTINFSTAMTDTNYSVSTSGAAFTPTTTAASGGNYQGPASHSYLTTSVSVHCGSNESTPEDWAIVCAQIFGN